MNRPSEDVTITNCIVHHAHRAVVIGSETSGGIRNVVADNITADGTENGIRIKSRRGRGGVEDLRFDNWTMMNVGAGNVVTSYYVMGGEEQTTKQPVSNRTPVFRSINISNVSIEGAKRSIDIEGLPEMLIAGLQLSNVIASGELGLTASYTDAMRLHSLEINAYHGQAFQIDNSTNLVLDNVTSSKPLAGFPVIRLTDTPGTILENSRAFPETMVFLATASQNKSEIHLSNYVFTNARVPLKTESN